MACCFKNQEKVRLQKRDKLFSNAQAKISKAFDAVKLVKQIQKFNIMKSVILEKRQRKMLKYALINTIDTSSEKIEYYAKDWQEFLKKIRMFRDVVEHSLTEKTDAQLISRIISKKDVEALMINDVPV